MLSAEENAQLTQVGIIETNLGETLRQMTLLGQSLDPGS
jgi:hypothetical protein